MKTELNEGQWHFGFEDDLFNAKVDNAVKLLRSLAGKDYFIAYSGGKDSDAILELCKMAGLDRRPVYHVTTIDPPEVVQHCREQGATFDHCGTNFYREVEKRGLPTRWRRWCCRTFKHTRAISAYAVLGVRRLESAARAARWQEVNRDADRVVVCPIVDWSAADVWRFLNERGVKACCLYQEGFNRLGCIGCCLCRGARIRDFQRWPSVGVAVRKAFFKYLEDEEYWYDWVNDKHGNGREPVCQFLDLWAGGMVHDE